MIETLANYLGNPASTMLEAMPFKDWLVEKSFEDDLPERIIHYVFPKLGFELRCDSKDRVSTIFLYSDEFNGFDNRLLDIRFSSNRQQVLKFFGTPSKSGNKINDSILGECGAWDRFSMPGCTIHVEYQTDADSIKKITLIRPDAVP